MNSAGAIKTILGLVVLGAFLAGCSNSSATEFCETYADTEALMNDGPREDALGWSAEITGSFSALEEITPAELEGSVEVIKRLVVPAVEAWDQQSLREVTRSQEFVEASAIMHGYFQVACGWPPWPPSPAYGPGPGRARVGNPGVLAPVGSMAVPER